MKIVVLQIKPKLCMDKEEFYQAIEEGVQKALQFNPEIIVFPEALGLWMSMMKPYGVFARIANWILPSHLQISQVIHSSSLTALNLEENYKFLLCLQFSRYNSNYVFEMKNIESRNLSDIEAYNLKEFKAQEKHSHLLAKVADWVFSHVNLSFIGRFLKSKEQLSIYKECFSAVAKKYQVNIQAGSIFVQTNLKSLHNLAFTFNALGEIISIQPKVHPIAFEDMIGVDAGSGEEVFDINGIICGVAICADVNFPNDHISRLKEKGCQVVFCPSGGMVPYHGWKWDFERDIKNAHWARSQEEDVVIVRPYNAGDLIPDVLMFQGRSSVTTSCDKTLDGSGVLYLVPESDIAQECIFCIDV